MLLPLMCLARAGLRTPDRWRFLLYFAALGLGFIMIEMALLQRFTLFLGQPVYTFAVVLASLLVFTGAGAYLAERLRLPPRRKLRLIVPLILATLLATAFVTPRLFSVALGLTLSWRVLLSVLLIAPLGILLGMPFPTGLRIVADEASSLVPWAWGINGFFTVIGTSGALMLGMALGFSRSAFRRDRAAFCTLRVARKSLLQWA
jgi:predicted membrane-bound spermidine synthase